MANGLVIHIEVGTDRHTEMLTRERIRIGAGVDCDLRLHQDALPAANGLVLELTRSNGRYRITDFDQRLPLTFNGEPLLAGTQIDDGDMVRVEQTNFAIQLFPISEAPAMVPNRRADVHIAPFIENAAIEAAATARRDDAKVFLREFTRELIREINPSTKIITFLIVTALVGGLLYLGFAGYRELKQSRHQIEAQNSQIAKLNDQLDASKRQFEQVDKRNQDFINSITFAPKLWSEFGKGVCLISGTYIFVEPSSGRPLRYPEPQQTGEESVTHQEGEPPPMLTPEGRGAIAEFPYVGTGFHVGGGYILTNRHVAVEPWVADERSMVFSSSVNGKPRLTRLLAYFPGYPQPFTLRFKQASQKDDLAVCKLDVPEVPVNIPVLPLDTDSDAAAVGKAVVLMGYPSGPDRILASLPDEDANGIKQRFGSSLDILVGHLAERNLIKPLTTQGHITDLEVHRMIYDARTAEGGSGAPLFGQSGRVIGVNFAIFTEVADANFAVPIRFGVALLQRAGWKPESGATEATTNSNAATKDATRVAPVSNPVH